jgi:hypothetical protein
VLSLLFFVVNILSNASLGVSSIVNHCMDVHNVAVICRDSKYPKVFSTPSYQIVVCFDISGFTDFVIHLDICTLSTPK